MKVIIFALALVAAAAAASLETVPQIIRSVYDHSPDGRYNFDFETDNGISRNENGEIKQVLNEDNKPQDVVVVRGSYSYVNPDGVSDTITYYADETGYHAEGASIPKVESRR